MSKSRQCLLLLAVCLLEACAPPYPSDATLIASFQRERSTYELLARMVEQDRQLEHGSYSWFWNAQVPYNDAGNQTVLSASRWDVYRELFLKLDLDGDVSIDEGNVFFSKTPNTCFGITVPGRTKGIALLRKPPRYTLRSLDSVPGEGDFYRHLQGHWYLFLTRT